MLITATKNPASDRGAGGADPELVVELVERAVEVVPWAAVLRADVEEGVGLGYKRELVYVVQEEVAGMTGGAPGGSWLSPRQTVNSSGLYEAGMLKKHPIVSNLFSQKFGDVTVGSQAL